MTLGERWSKLGRGPKAVVAVVVTVAVLAIVLVAVADGLFICCLYPSPNVSFSLAEYPNGTATVAYEGGPPIQGENIVVEVGNRSTTWRDEDGNVTVGDTVTVEAHQGETLLLVYTGGDGKSVIQEFEVGEAKTVGSLLHVESRPSVVGA